MERWDLFGLRTDGPFATSYAPDSTRSTTILVYSTLRTAAAHGEVSLFEPGGVEVGRQEVTLNRLRGKIVLGRHGETVFNRDGFIMGRTDSFLTSEALIRARGMGPVLAREGISKIYCSPLGRTAMTASIYSQLLGVPLHFRPEMPELSCGIWEGRVRREIVQNSLWLRKTWEDRPPGGESYRDAEARVGPFLKELLNTLAPDSTILVIGHAGVNRVFLKLLLGLDPSQAIAIRSPHELVYFIEGEGSVRYKGLGGEEGEGMLREAQ